VDIAVQRHTRGLVDGLSDERTLRMKLRQREEESDGEEQFRKAQQWSNEVLHQGLLLSCDHHVPGDLF
jgi:hypothetical protein